VGFFIAYKMPDYTQDQMRDPAIWYEHKQAYDLSLICKSCIHHKYTADSKRICSLKALKGSEMSMCGEFRPKG
jgi:hypothetical protein